jgi:adenylosuccinate lyase
VERLEEQMRLLFNIPFAAKFGGAGNYNAHHVAYPQIDWRKFGGNLLKKT